MTHSVEQQLDDFFSSTLVSSVFLAVNGDITRFPVRVHPQKNLVRQAQALTWGQETKDTEASSSPAILKRKPRPA